MKILLIHVPGKTFRKAAEKGRPYRSYAATTLIQLSALVPPELAADVQIVDLMTTPLPATFHADIVGISTWTCGAPEAYRIADSARQRRMTVVLGGSHPSQMPDEAMEHADAVVVGPAERSWPRLLRDFTHGCLQPVYRDYTDPFSESLPRLNRGLLNKRRYYITDCLEATRGCPNRCHFCVVENSTRGQCWKRAVGDVVDEIKGMGKRVLFLDSSITEFKAYAEKLWRQLVPLNITWYSTATLRFAEDEDAVKLAAKSGCRGVLIGFESINQASLNGVDKRFNKTTQYKDLIKRLHDHGIMVLGCFVFGFEGDDPAVFEATVELVDSARIDLVRYAILTPFPGTPLHALLHRHRRILSHDWGLYDTEHAVFKPAGMSPVQLEEGWKWAYLQTYTCSSMIKRLARLNNPFILSVPANLHFRKIALEFNRTTDDGGNSPSRSAGTTLA